MEKISSLFYLVDTFFPVTWQLRPMGLFAGEGLFVIAFLH